MKGDFTRQTFRPSRHYWGVLRQQGRVDVDADWNEQVAIAREQHRTRTRDVIGDAGGPEGDAGFEISVDSSGAISVGAGRYYVSGIQCVNETGVALTAQPDADPTASPPGSAGLHVVYLDVWDRHLTALDDPLLREVALGGPDTATRARTVWQVRAESLGAPSPAVSAAISPYAAATTPEARQTALVELRRLAHEAYCAAPIDPLGGSLESGTGTMAARAAAAGSSTTDPCRFEPGGGYRRLENRLYRVEIHTPGSRNDATFKWSRDNGSIVTAVEEFVVANPGDTTTVRVRVRRLGLDSEQDLSFHDWVEVVGDDDERAGRPGVLARITNHPSAEERVLELSRSVAVRPLGLHPKVRRWDMSGSTGERPTRGTWTELEDGVEVSFSTGTYHTGDYWLIPARKNTADIEWPPHPSFPGEVVTGAPESLAPQGIEHRRTPLALIAHDGTQALVAIDLRRLYPYATRNAVLSYAGGDGQEPRRPGGGLPQPIQVAVSKGEHPVEGALVRFDVVAGGGTLDAGGLASATLVVPTGTDGIASANWTVDTSRPDHRARARLLDRCEADAHVPVFFNAHVNYKLHYLGGDGQQALPLTAVSPLRVWVSDGRWPVQGATVDFAVSAGGGSLSAATVVTDADGVAQTVWTLGAAGDQQVEARLREASSADLHHQAFLTFNADLGLASQVAYTPAAGCTDLAGTTTVQEALDELCLREGGRCTVHVAPGADLASLFASLQAGFQSGAICLSEGTYQVDAPLTLRGKGHVTITGLGPATRVVASGSESVFVISDCESVSIRSLHAESDLGRGAPGLGGVLTVLDCGAVTIEDVSVACGPGPEPLATGITVRRSGKGTRAAEPVRIMHCDVVVGEQQQGILVVGSERIHVADNTVRAAAQASAPPFATLLQNRRYRAWVRSGLVSFDTSPGQPRQPAHGWSRITIQLSTPAGGTLSAWVRVGSQPFWQSLLEAARSAPEAKREVDRILDAMLLEAGRFDSTRVFRNWYRAAEAEYVQAGSRGIVVGGVVARDVRILDNSVEGMLQGVSVALSGGVRRQAETVQVRGNTVVVPGNSVVSYRGEGIFVGNTASLVVDENDVRVTAPATSPRAIDGVRIHGVIGPRVLVRGGHFDGTVVGARITPLAPQPAVRRWVASDNVAASGTMLEAPCTVMEDANAPPRSKPCAGDRPL